MVEPGCPACRLYDTNHEWRKLWGREPTHIRIVEVVPTQSWKATPCCKEPEPVDEGITWAVGITTVPKRGELLRKTLASLKEAGFDLPWLFVDGACREWLLGDLVLGVTQRSTPSRVHGNWYLALTELWIRNPFATRFMVVQDDVMFCAGLREYLESSYPTRSYCNLFTSEANGRMCGEVDGWYSSNQRGTGALALVFDRQAVMQLLVSHHMMMRSVPDGEELQRVGKQAILNGAWHRGQRAVDGGVVTALAQAGIKEFVHKPSLVQHTGTISSFSGLNHQLSPSFTGRTTSK